MGKSSPAISVMMPVYNGMPFLSQAIESILSQTFTDFELLAVDDGSCDGSAKVLDEYAGQDPRVRVIHRNHEGLLAALKEAASRARGEFFARMDADDISRPNRLQRQVEFLNEHPEVAVVWCAAELIDPADQTAGFWAPELGDDMLLELAAGNPVVHGSVMMRRSDFEAAEGYQRPPEDYDLWIRLARRGKRFRVISAEPGGGAGPGDGLYAFRVHPQRYSLTAARAQSQAILQVQLPLLEECMTRADRGCSQVLAKLIEGWGRVGASAQICGSYDLVRRAVRWIFALRFQGRCLDTDRHAGDRIDEAFRTAAESLVWAGVPRHMALRLRLTEWAREPLQPRRWRDLLLCLPAAESLRQVARRIGVRMPKGF